MEKQKLNHIKNLLVFLTVMLLVAGSSFAGIKSKVNKGNKLYNKQKFEEALSKYRDAETDEPENPVLHFNVGDALYKTEKYEEAIKEFEKATYSRDIELQAKSYYNTGNCLYRQDKLPESVQYYKKCLELNPDDEDAKFNYEFVQKKIKEMMDKNKQSTGENKKQKEDQKLEKKDEKQMEKDKKDEEKKAEEKDQISKEDAERILKALNEDERKAMKQKKQQNIEYDWGNIEKDW